MTMSDVLELVIADDHPVVRAGIRGMLSSQPDFSIVGEASNGDEAVDLVLRLQPDVLLLDLRMPGGGGLSAIRRLSDAAPNVRILVLTTYDSDADILPALDAGAIGYLLKDAPREELFGAVRCAARGERTLAPAVAQRLTSRGHLSLTTREVEVLQLIATGASNRDVAERLGVTEATIKSHVIHIFQKLGVDDRTAAVARGVTSDLIRLEPPGPVG
jgi:DNA-binding NarL/FixJ family response regulator